MSFRDLDKKLLSRFFLVTVIGFGFDFLVAYVLIRAGQVSVPAAASAGFVSAFLLNCVMHERFTFGSFTQRVSLRRSAGILLGALTALATRLLVIVSLEPVFKPTGDRAAVLVLVAAGVSCAVNFYVTSRAVRPHGIRTRRQAKA
ncbi:GtrA family protein [Methylobacterium sp.]|jgi:putative flippase GtrA|uniref:GtrA family protein n=1 Tax=Methylobacterium sp. TaxID=409 RepID=UPI002625339E|nr:GtrA family protein [Methylobacterium sp.]MDB5648434.1 hypothetical protein [Methylobacterium sp.]